MKWDKKLFLRRTVEGLRVLCCALSFLFLLPSLSAVSSTFEATARASSYPDHQIEISVAFSPGGALDIATRALAREAEASLGQPVIPLNVPGGGGILGVAQTSRAKPDGYHLVAAVSNALIFQPWRNPAPYRPLRDLEPIISFGQAAPVLVSSTQAPWDDVRAFLQATRDKKGAMRVGIPGLGSPSHIVLMMISQQDPSLAWRFVPFAGPGEAETALLGGHVDAAVSGALSRVQSGQLKPLLTLASQRLPGLPHIPALAEKGFADPGRGDSAFVLLAPAGTPEERLHQLERAFLQAANSEAWRKSMEVFSVTPLVRGRADTKAFLREAWQEEGKILRLMGMAEQPATKAE